MPPEVAPKAVASTAPAWRSSTHPIITAKSMAVETTEPIWCFPSVRHTGTAGVERVEAWRISGSPRGRARDLHRLERRFRLVARVLLHRFEADRLTRAHRGRDG